MIDYVYGNKRFRGEEIVGEMVIHCPRGHEADLLLDCLVPYRYTQKAVSAMVLAFRGEMKHARDICIHLNGNKISWSVDDGSWYRTMGVRVVEFCDMFESLPEDDSEVEEPYFIYDPDERTLSLVGYEKNEDETSRQEEQPSVMISTEVFDFVTNALGFDKCSE